MRIQERLLVAVQVDHRVATGAIDRQHRVTAPELLQETQLALIQMTGRMLAGDELEAVADHFVQAAFRRALAHAPCGAGAPAAAAAVAPASQHAVLDPRKRRHRRHLAGAERRVALGDLVEVVLVDHLPQEQGHLRDRGHVRATLRLVAVQQVLGGAPAQDQVQFPRQVDAVAHAGTGALPHVRHHGVRSVAREEHAPLAPALGDARLEGVDHVAQQLQVVRPQAIAFMQPAPAGVLLFPIGRFLAGQHTQLETVRRVPIGMCM